MDRTTALTPEFSTPHTIDSYVVRIGQQITLAPDVHKHLSDVYDPSICIVFLGSLRQIDGGVVVILQLEHGELGRTLYYNLDNDFPATILIDGSTIIALSLEENGNTLRIQK